MLLEIKFIPMFKANHRTFEHVNKMKNTGTCIKVVGDKK